MNFFNIFSTIVMIILALLSLFYFYWSFGGKFALDKVTPKLSKNELLLSNNFNVFFKGIWFLLIFIFLYSVEFYKFDFNNNFIIGILWLISIFFFLRAIGEYNLFGFFKKFRNSTFWKYDTFIYSPLALLLAIYFFSISYIKTFNW